MQGISYSIMVLAYQFTTIILGYLKDSNAAAHSVDSDIFNAVIHLSARFKT